MSNPMTVLSSVQPLDITMSKFPLIRQGCVKLSNDWIVYMQLVNIVLSNRPNVQGFDSFFLMLLECMANCKNQVVCYFHLEFCNNILVVPCYPSLLIQSKH